MTNQPRKRRNSLEFFIEQFESRRMLTTIPQGELLLDINSGSGASTPASFAELGSEILFFANSSTGWELWKTNGSTQGTQLVREINPSGDSVFLSEDIIVAGGKAFFGANDGNGKELWVSDGTTNVTMKLDIGVGVSSDPSHIVAFGNSVMFVANDGVNGRELWISDGSANGTSLVKDINPSGDAFASFGSGLHLHTDGYVYFGANNNVNGVELWRSDGTTSGTTLHADINTFSSSTDSNPNWLTSVGDSLFFSAFNFESGRELYRTKPSAGGSPVYSTQRITNLYSGFQKSSNPMWLTELNGELIFSAQNSLANLELWKYDGSSVSLLKDINVGSAGSTPVDFAVSNGLVYFTANQDPLHGAEPWVTDGTVNGTQLLKDINPGAAGDSFAVGYHAFAGETFFGAFNPASGFELYKSDGTPNGTALFQSFNPGSANGLSPAFYSNSDFMLFGAGDNTTGIELFIIDTRNSAPETLDDFANTDEDSAVTVDVLANDSDPEGNPLALDNVGITSGEGTVAIVNNQVHYDPGTSYNRLGNGESETVTISYDAVDDLLAATPATLQITINGTNDDPVFTTPIAGPTANVLIGEELEYTASIFDPDENDILSVEWTVTDEDGNVVAEGSSASFDFVPNALGTFTIQAIVTDGISQSTESTSLEVTAAFLDGTRLVIQGTDNNDRIKVVSRSGEYNVSVGRDRSTYNVADVTDFLIFGYDGNDVITLSSAVTVSTEIQAGDGDDRVTGGGGSDSVFGGSGRDRINGKNGDDFLYGDDDDDTLAGGNGDDFLQGGEGDDKLSGNNGDDEMEGNEGDDRLTGGKDDDTLRGGDDNDRLVGSAGNDMMFGEIGDDFLAGGGGDDLLNGGPGIDTLNGGNGSNTLIDDDDE